MTVRLLDPKTHVSLPLYHRVAVEVGDMQRQVARHENGHLVAHNLAAQMYRRDSPQL